MKKKTKGWETVWEGRLLLTGLCLAVGLGWSAARAQEDHSEHDMSSEGADAQSAESHADHDMSPELMAELRAKVRMYKDYSDQQIMLSMEMMGRDYPLYVSDKSLQGDVGVLILGHGFREVGDKRFTESMSELSSVFPTAIGFGMAMMSSSHIQTSIDELEAAGAKTIVVVPTVSTKYTELYRQYLYILGLADEAAYASVPRVSSNAELIFADPPGDDPLMAETILDFANEMGDNPANELVIVVAHGPTADDENAASLQILDTLAGYIKQDGGFVDVKTVSLQDDAPLAIRSANVERLRAMVKEANEAGQKVIIVSNLMAARSIQAKIRKDLDGLDYVFNSKGLTEHPNFVKWLTQTVRSKIES